MHNIPATIALEVSPEHTMTSPATKGEIRYLDQGGPVVGYSTQREWHV